MPETVLKGGRKFSKVEERKGGSPLQFLMSSRSSGKNQEQRLGSFKNKKIMLPKQYRLSPKDFQRVYKNGFKIKGEFGMLVGLKDSVVDSPKLGIVVNKKVGNAVVRHRTTRQIREIGVQILKTSLPLFYEYISFKPVEKIDDLKKELSLQFEQIQERLK